VLSRAALGLWALSMVVAGTALMAAHWVALPVADGSGGALAREILARDVNIAGRWHLVHVLFSECRCSARVMDHLLSRPVPADVQEHVVLVGKADGRAQRVRDHGLDVMTVTPQELAQRFEIEAAPLLVVVDPQGMVRYLGGYTTHPQGLDYRELEILGRARQELEVGALPTFGCAVSQRLQSYLDPLRLKYAR
jgi:hypothetical protein